MKTPPIAFLAFVCFVLLLIGCKSSEYLINPNLSNDFSIINGDTVRAVINKDYKMINSKDPNAKNYILVGDTIVTYQEPKLHTPPTKAPDLSNLKNNDDADLKGKPLRYVAIGGSLTAGVRDGGYFNEGILTSYPNLIARQMKLEKFEQPLFDKEDYNGFGRKVLTTDNPSGGPVPKFKAVNNNTGVTYIDGQTIKLDKYKGELLNNLALPNINSYYLHPFANAIGKDNLTQELGKRITGENYDNLYKYLLKHKADFFTYEMGWEEIWDIIRTGNWVSNGSAPNPTSIFKERRADDFANLNLNGEVTFMFGIKDNHLSKSGCFINLPNILDLPYFKIVSKESLNTIINKFSPSLIFIDNILVVPTSEIDSLLGTSVNMIFKKGISLEKPLSKRSFITEQQQKDMLSLIESYNKQTESFSKYFDFPVVDLNNLYRRILKGDYITDDGVRVDSNYPKGNFFSADGIYPTAFGQTVIANEVIKTLNSFYKTQIPLIITGEYLERK